MVVNLERSMSLSDTQLASRTRAFLALPHRRANHLCLLTHVDHGILGSIASKTSMVGLGSHAVL